jgi:membrane protein DedA with SNARE-associated domain
MLRCRPVRDRTVQAHLPLPADLVMFAVGERVAAGTFPLWLAVIGFEVISVLGTTTCLFGGSGVASENGK